ncbi:MAG: patatin family protein [Lachnospiraceae bacterium]|nr:patatin family protein [Lachnospiraceae bacterium]MBQ9593800.1 patatin family protein [Lachnospiraceae bacterium]
MGDYKTGLVLEGGGTRGIFTSGVLDRMMREGIEFPYVVGVSAGSCNGVGFVAKQIGRTRDCMLPTPGDKLVSVRNLRKAHSLYDMSAIFDRYPYQEYPFDFKTFFESPTEFEAVATDCLTGEAVYLSETDPENGPGLMLKCKASCSLPFFAAETVVDGRAYMDGGLADSIPVARAAEKGCERFVVVLTRLEGFRRKKNSRLTRAMERVYRRYPELIRTMDERYLMYNREVEEVERLEAEGKAFVIRPKDKIVKKTETNREMLLEFYKQGYQQMDDRMEELKKFLDEKRPAQG